MLDGAGPTQEVIPEWKARLGRFDTRLLPLRDKPPVEYSNRD